MKLARSLAIVGTSVLVLAPALITIAAGPASATASTCSASVPEVGSIDADHSPDLAVGVTANETASVDLHLTHAGGQLVGLSALTGATIAGDTGQSFGAALASIDLNHDGCSELVVGVPDVNASGSGIGSVDLVSGGPSGLTAHGLKVIRSTHAYDGFGSSVAVSSRTADKTGKSDLWVGAPDRRIEGKLGAGAVDHYEISADGSVTYTGTVTAMTSGVAGAIKAGAHFGSVLSADALDVVIGTPDDMINGHAGAGSVTMATVNPSSGAISSARRWTQSTTGVPGTPEAWDHFGAAVFATPDGGALVGVPGQDVGSAKNAGVVQVLGATAAGAQISQDTAGIPGTAETGDHFGTSVVAGTWLLCQESYDVAVGAPGEDIGTAKDAGGVTLLPLPGQTGAHCAAKALSQGTGGLGGAAESGDQVGATLAVLRGRTDLDEDTRDALVVGAPGENSGKATDAGVVTVHGQSTTSYSFTGGPARGQKYGQVLTAAGGGPMFTS